MQPLQWDHRPDGLRNPALVCAFKGWNDAADAASSAIEFVGGSLHAERFAVIDPEEFSDFEAPHHSKRSLRNLAHERQEGTLSRLKQRSWHDVLDSRERV